MNLSLLTEYGVDYREGVARCMNDVSLYKRLLELFLQDDSFARAQAAYERGDQRTLFHSVHELKGACGNAGMRDLFEKVCPLVELLRDGDAEPQRVKPLFDAMQAAYDHTYQGVQLVLNSPAQSL